MVSPTKETRVTVMEKRVATTMKAAITAEEADPNTRKCDSIGKEEKI